MSGYASATARKFTSAFCNCVSAAPSCCIACGSPGFALAAARLLMALLAILALGLHVSDCAARTRARPAAHKAAAAPARQVAPTSGAARDANAVATEFDGWLDAVAQSGQVSGLAAAIVKGDQVLLQR